MCQADDYREQNNGSDEDDKYYAEGDFQRIYDKRSGCGRCEFEKAADFADL
jgi:hypothetical protein